MNEHTQATLVVGTIGHASHGKSSLIKALCGVDTIRFTKERARNITIKLGYANMKIFKCQNSSCAPPSCYQSFNSDAPEELPCSVANCGGKLKLVRYGWISKHSYEPLI
jgi:translation initiation factor 2 subunit 3